MPKKSIFRYSALPVRRGSLRLHLAPLLCESSLYCELLRSFSLSPQARAVCGGSRILRGGPGPWMERWRASPLPRRAPHGAPDPHASGEPSHGAPWVALTFWSLMSIISTHPFSAFCFSRSFHVHVLGARCGESRSHVFSYMYAARWPQPLTSTSPAAFRLAADLLW